MVPPPPPDTHPPDGVEQPPPPPPVGPDPWYPTARVPDPDLHWLHVWQGRQWQWLPRWLWGGWVASGSSSPLRLRRAPPSAHRGCQTLQATVQETLQDTPSRRIIETFALSSSVESLGPMTQAVMEGARLRSALSRGEGRLDHGRRERVVWSSTRLTLDLTTISRRCWHAECWEKQTIQ